MEPTYHLEGVLHDKDSEDFEGPLTVILMLLARNKIEIRDIRISEILEQYLAYLAEMEAMDLEVTSEFVQMASQLLVIKTKMLLHTEEEVSELEQLMKSLEALRAKDRMSTVKQVIPVFQQRTEQGGLSYTKQPEPPPVSTAPQLSLDMPDLLAALFRALTRDHSSTQPAPDTGKRIVAQRIVYSIRDKSTAILQRFFVVQNLSMRQLYLDCRSRSEVVATFVSVLELVSMGEVSMTPEQGDLILRFTGESVDAALDKLAAHETLDEKLQRERAERDASGDETPDENVPDESIPDQPDEMPEDEGLYPDEFDTPEVEGAMVSDLDYTEEYAPDEPEYP